VSPSPAEQTAFAGGGRAETVGSAAPALARSERLSRRSFLVSAGGFSLAVLFARTLAFASRSGEAVKSGLTSLTPNAWITISADGTLTIMSAQSEMGQGVMTSLPLLIAEEMDADWARVRVIQAPADPKTFGNPGFGGIQNTGGSRSTAGFYEKLRLIGAQTRKVLLICAASVLKVPQSELSTDTGFVVHARTGRRISYGQLAHSAVVPAVLPEATKADLKPPERWRLLGRDVPRLDLAAKVNGSAGYGIDVRRPDMLHALVFRAPVQGERPLSVDDTAAKAVSGRVAIVPLPYGVGVVATTSWGARQARNLLNVTWTREARARQYDSERIREEYEGIANDRNHRGVDIFRRGDMGRAPQHGGRVFSATYTTDHVHHATMETLNCTALFDSGGLTLWSPTQAQTITQLALAHALEIPPEKVAVNTTLLGCGLGRKGEVDFEVDAALLAKAVPGRPVKLLWTREDDVRNGKYRPLTAQAIRVHLDATGQILDWHHRLVCESIFARYLPSQFEASGGRDEPVTDGMTPQYDIPNVCSEYVHAPRGVDVGFWRAVGAGYTAFAVESMIDEIAAALRTDPVELRLRLLHNKPRAQRVVRAVAEMAGWGRALQGTALGVACTDAFGTHCAQIVEIELDRESGQIRVRQVWCAVDPGVVVQPSIVEAQMMGAIIMGVSSALHERISFKGGEVQESNFHNYPVIRMSEAPDIRVKVLPSLDAPPTGVGEVGLVPVAPAIANAFATLTEGKRLRQLPLRPERVKSVLV
jgi:isoquinoline 1-oxidoreductase subunit beta